MKNNNSLMKKLGILITNFPVFFFIISLFIVALPISQLPKTTLDTSTEGFLFDNDPILTDYEKFKSQFGQDERVIVAIGEIDIFTQKNLQKLKALHEKILQDVPYVKEVNSLINARNTRGEGDNLIVEDFLENMPQSAQSFLEIKNRALTNRLYKNLFISEDGKFSALVIEPRVTKVELKTQDDLLGGFDDIALDVEESTNAQEPQKLGDKEYSEMIQKLRVVTEKFNSEDFPIHLAGSPIVNTSLKESMQKDMQTFMRLIILVIAIVLFLMFKRVSGVLVPIILVALALLATGGAMAFFGTAIKIPTQVLPSMLLAVGTGASIHILALFFHALDKTGDKKSAIIEALDHSGVAIVMTSLTTAVGIGSFATANVAPISDLGIYGSFGVLVSLLLTLIFLPALLMLLPLKQKAKEKKSLVERYLETKAHYIATKPKTIVALSGVLLLISLAILTQVKLSHYPLGWFPKEHEVRVTTNLIDDKMKGSTSLEFILKTDDENGWYDPQRLRQLALLEKSFESIETDEYFAGKATSLATVIKEINRALHENRENFYTVPRERELIAQEFLLFANSGSDDLEDVTDSKFQLARVTLKVPYTDAFVTLDLIHDLEKVLNETMKEDLESVTITGVSALLGRTFSAAVESAASSYFFAIIGIGLMMVVMMRSIKLGLMSLIPNLLPIIVALAIMVIFSMPLDMFTMLVGSIVMGLAIDDTVHFMYNFRKYYHQYGDSERAIKETFHTSGVAIVVTSIVLSIGFFVYLFAMMQSVVNFGLISGIAIILALLSNLLLAPALMVLFVKNQPKEEI